jgi:hypothetical protein
MRAPRAGGIVNHVFPYQMTKALNRSTEESEEQHVRVLDPKAQEHV